MRAQPHTRKHTGTLHTHRLQGLLASLLEAVTVQNPVEVHARALVDNLAARLPAASAIDATGATGTETSADASAGAGRSAVGALGEACVLDVISSTIVCESGTQMVQLTERLLKGFDPAGGTGLRISVAHLSNRFAALDPTHFRTLTFTLKLSSWDKATEREVVGYAELRIHHAPIRAFNAEEHSAEHYDFFRNRISSGQGNEDRTAAHISSTLENVLTFLIEAAAVPVPSLPCVATLLSQVPLPPRSFKSRLHVLALTPSRPMTQVLLSLLVLVFTTSTGIGEEDLEMLPQTSYELYSMATQSAVTQRLLTAGRVANREDGAALVEAGGDGADAAVEEGPRRVKEKRKSTTADWRKGAALPKGETASDMDLTEAEIALVYKVVAKVFTLLAQGRMGLSELKQAYLPKDKKLRPLVSKMLDVAHKKSAHDVPPAIFTPHHHQRPALLAHTIVYALCGSVVTGDGIGGHQHAAPRRGRKPEEWPARVHFASRCPFTCQWWTRSRAAALATPRLRGSGEQGTALEP